MVLKVSRNVDINDQFSLLKKKLFTKYARVSWYVSLMFNFSSDKATFN